jgi:hypothetical protein
MVGGLLGLVFSALLWSSSSPWSRRKTVAGGDRIVEERRIQREFYALVGSMKPSRYAGPPGTAADLGQGCATSRPDGSCRRLRRRSGIATTGWTMTPRGPISIRGRAIPRPTGRRRRADLIGPTAPTSRPSHPRDQWSATSMAAASTRPRSGPAGRQGSPRVGEGLSRPFVHETPGHPEPLGRPPPSAWAAAATPVPGHRYRDRDRDGRRPALRWNASRSTTPRSPP